MKRGDVKINPKTFDKKVKKKNPFIFFFAVVAIVISLGAITIFILQQVSLDEENAFGLKSCSLIGSCEGCVGNYDCSLLNNQFDCEDNSPFGDYCNWNYDSSCQGNLDCTVYSSISECNQHSLCFNQCTGTPNCGKYSDKSSCESSPEYVNGICFWDDSGTAGSEPNCAQGTSVCQDLTPENCNSIEGCTWNCAFAQGCPSLNDAYQCNNHNGCYWRDGYCSGYGECISKNFNEDICNSMGRIGCSWSVEQGSCGNGVCDNGETCLTCSNDCGCLPVVSSCNPFNTSIKNKIIQLQSMGHNIHTTEGEKINKSEYVLVPRVIDSENNVWNNRLLRVAVLYNSSSSTPSDDKVEFRDVISGEIITTFISSEGHGSVLIGGKTRSVTYNFDINLVDTARQIILDWVPEGNEVFNCSWLESKYNCGDGLCNLNENCSVCSNDCGACFSCGDGSCNGNENCSVCSNDCGNCTNVGTTGTTGTTTTTSTSSTDTQRNANSGATQTPGILSIENKNIEISVIAEQTADARIKVSNTGGGSLTVNSKLSGLQNIANISNPKFTLLAGEKGIVQVRILASQEGTYSGEAIINNQKVALKIIVKKTPAESLSLAPEPEPQTGFEWSLLNILLILFSVSLAVISLTIFFLMKKKKRKK